MASLKGILSFVSMGSVTLVASRQLVVRMFVYDLPALEEQGLGGCFG